MGDTQGGGSLHHWNLWRVVSKEWGRGVFE